MKPFGRRGIRVPNPARGQALRSQLRFESLEERRLLALTPYSLPISSGTMQFVIPHFTQIGNEAFFYVDASGSRNYALWKTDGTVEGTVPLVSGMTRTDAMAELNGELFFRGPSSYLWKTDGTPSGATQVSSTAHVQFEMLSVGDTLYFADPTDQLWRSDGTTEGTVLLKDFPPATQNLYPRFLTEVDGTLFFMANDGAHGVELWKSDGTEAGTVLVKDINPGPDSGFPAGLVNVDGTLFFGANDGANGYELWKSDGTESGTVMVADINPGSGDSRTPAFNGTNSLMFNHAGTLFFEADDGTHGKELWRSDGTSVGTQLVLDAQPGPGSGQPNGMVEVGGSLYLQLNDGVHGGELWKTDGTSGGTMLVADIRPGSESSAPNHLTNVSGSLLFRANDGALGRELWRSDGTAEGTVLVADLYAGPLESLPDDLWNFNGMLLFTADGQFTDWVPWLLPAVSVDLNGAVGGSNYSVSWDGSPVAVADAAAAVDVLGTTLLELTATLSDPQPGDVLSADVSGTSILASFDGTTLSLSGEDSVEHYNQVLRSITYDNTDGQAPAINSQTLTVDAVNGSLGIHQSAETRLFLDLGPTVDLNGPSAGTDENVVWAGLPVSLATAATIVDPDSSALEAIFVELYGAEPGDTLTADPTGTNISVVYANDVLTLSGADSLANYEQVLRTIKYSYGGAGVPTFPKLALFTAVDDTGRIDAAATATIDLSPFAAVIGRHVFYNESKFDGNSADINASDDGAIAPDKSPYLPGSGVATFDNITSYTRGINGVMVDIFNPAGTITLADFAFRVGANNTPSSWLAAPAPIAFSVRPGAGVGGMDRVEIVWANNAIENVWLEVILEGNDSTGGFNTNTGLVESDVFYFGNRIGDTGSGTPTLAVTSAVDEIAARGNAGAGAAIFNVFDFDRNGVVGAADSIAARMNTGTLRKINLTDPPAVPAATMAATDAAIATGLAFHTYDDQPGGDVPVLDLPSDSRNVWRPAQKADLCIAPAFLTRLPIVSAAHDLALDHELLESLLDELVH